MDEKMKGNVIALLVVGCFALGLMGQFGGTWLTDSETDADTGITSESEYGLHEVTTTLSGDADTVTAMEGMLDTASPGWNEINFADKYENCTEELDAARANAKAAGATDEMFEEGAKDNIDDCNDVGAMADAGSYGGMTLWVATVAALIAAIVVMAGMSGGIDALPEQTGMIAQWAAGALTALAVLLWYMNLPDSGDASAGMTVWLTCLGAVCGLAAGAMTTFMGGDEAAEEAPAAE